MEIKNNILTSEVFLKLYCSVGWEPPLKDQVEMALKHSFANFTAFDGEKPIGMVRVIGDGGMSFYIKDFAVIPSYQGKGVGLLLLERLEQYIIISIPNNWAVSLELISTNQAVDFYKKKGFKEQISECDGSGMIKMLR